MKYRLLLADADAGVADHFRAYFSAAGYRVETAADGLDCLGSLRWMRPDLLVLDRDLLWGGSDGVLACLREEVDARLPVVVVAAVLPVGALSRLRLLPVVRWIQKPVHMRALHECIDATIACAR